MLCEIIYLFVFIDLPIKTFFSSVFCFKFYLQNDMRRVHIKKRHYNQLFQLTIGMDAVEQTDSKVGSDTVTVSPFPCFLCLLKVACFCAF